jgi:tetratricopeptide (TPR) repeat protein
LLTAVARNTNRFEAQQLISALIHLAPAEAVSILNADTRYRRGSSWQSRLRGHAFVRLGNDEAALASFRQAVEQGRNSTNLLALAHHHLEHDNLAEAQAYADEAVKQTPREAICLLSQAVVRWVQGESAAALASLAEAKRGERRVAHTKDLQSFLGHAGHRRARANAGCGRRID